MKQCLQRAEELVKKAQKEGEDLIGIPWELFLPAEIIEMEERFLKTYSLYFKATEFLFESVQRIPRDEGEDIKKHAFNLYVRINFTD